MAIDSAGNAYVTGDTASSAFPTTPGAYQASPGAAFLTKFNPTGSALVYSTYLGNNSTNGYAVAVDESGAAYVIGFTNSSSFPTTPGALSTTGTGFVTKFNPSGSALLYSTLLPGTFGPEAIAVDPSGSAYVTGNDVFVMKLNPGGTALMYSTYLGHGNGLGIAVDAQGDAYVAGATGDPDFAVTAGAFQPGYGGGNDAFFTEVNPAGSALLYSTFLGGIGDDDGRGVALDPLGNAYVAGYTGSTIPSYPTFPTTPGAFQNAPVANATNAFVTKFSPGPMGTTSQTITFGALANEVYGAGPVTLNASASSGLTVVYSATGPVALQGDKLTILGTGPVTVTAFQTGDSTYVAATPVTRNFSVLKAVLTATAVNAERPFGTGNPIFTYQIAGYVNGDSSSVVGGTATLTTTATSTSPAGNYPITFATESLTATNYAFSYVSGTLTVSSDTTAPTVSLTGEVAGPPKKEIFSSKDNSGGSGLASVVVTKCTNCTSSTTTFTRGATSAVTTTATKTNQSLSSSVTIVATDVAGNSTIFDPVDLQLESKGRPTEHLVNINSKENIVLISNGKPGMSWMQFEVNGHRLPVVNLSSGESTKLDIGRYLLRGRPNQVLILADGKDDSTSWIIFTYGD